MSAQFANANCVAKLMPEATYALTPRTRYRHLARRRPVDPCGGIVGFKIAVVGWPGQSIRVIYAPLEREKRMDGFVRNGPTDADFDPGEPET
jgi:hypothetical protein